jgi:hypothetical protein
MNLRLSLHPSQPQRFRLKPRLLLLARDEAVDESPIRPLLLLFLLLLLLL